VFPLYARPLGDERRRDHVAGVAPLAQRAVQDVPRAAGLVTNAEFPRTRGAMEEPLELR
jgi:hypothetical protein